MASYIDQRERYLYRSYIAILYLMIIASAIVLGYELFCRRYLPSLSISHILHSIGLTSEPPREMEPGKGFGHTLGYIGSILMVFALSYPIRKRSNLLSRYASRKFWLDTHIFLGILGAVFITYHTTFIIGGLVSISYWSMIVVVISGIIGRFLYIQIPRSIAGNELGMEELDERADHIFRQIENLEMESLDLENLTERIVGPGKIKGKRPTAILLFLLMDNILFRFRFLSEKRRLFKRLKIRRRMKRAISNLLLNYSLLRRRILLLEKYQELLEYWKPTHIWLSIVMFFFMILHVAIALFFYVEN